jgi:hypothetical protein
VSADVQDCVFSRGKQESAFRQCPPVYAKIHRIGYKLATNARGLARHCKEMREFAGKVRSGGLLSPKSTEQDPPRGLPCERGDLRSRRTQCFPAASVFSGCRVPSVPAPFRTRLYRAWLDRIRPSNRSILAVSPGPQLLSRAIALSPVPSSAIRTSAVDMRHPALKKVCDVPKPPPQNVENV